MSYGYPDNDEYMSNRSINQENYDSTNISRQQVQAHRDPFKDVTHVCYHITLKKNGIVV